MNLNQIANELEKQAERWESILSYKTKPKDKSLADVICSREPDPKAKSIAKTIHPGKRILELLDKVYHHQKFPREMDARCNELYQEVTEAVPIWPSLEWGDVCKQSVVEHIRSFAQMLVDCLYAIKGKNGRRSKSQKIALIAAHLKEHPYATSIDIEKATGILDSEVRRLWKKIKQGYRDGKRYKPIGSKVDGKIEAEDKSASCKICRSPLSGSFQCELCKERITGECRTCHETNSHPDDAVP